MRTFPALALALVAGLVISAPAIAEDRPAPDAAAEVDIEDVVERLKSKESDQRLAAATEAEKIADDAVTKPLARLLTDDEFVVRAAAIRALATRTTDRGRKDAAKALGVRLGKIAKAAHGEGEQLLVIEALGKLAQPSSIKPLFDGITDETSEEVFGARMQAVAGIPDAEAIEELIKFLSARGRGKWAGRKRSVINALQTATGERFGGDPDEWRSWWKENRKTFDFEAAAERRQSDADKRAEREERKRNKKKRGKKDSDSD
jgi:hypothetical protein